MFSKVIIRNPVERDWYFGASLGFDVRDPNCRLGAGRAIPHEGSAADLGCQTDRTALAM